MATAVLDKPEVTGLEDFSVACAMHEVFRDKPPCDRTATLVVKMHSCNSTVSCQQCWQELVERCKRQQEEASKVSQFLGGWRCSNCGMTARTFDGLMWIEPL